MATLSFVCRQIALVLIQLNWYGHRLKIVARKNVTFRLDDAMKLAEEKSSVSSQRKNGGRGETMPFSANKITFCWNLLMTTFQNKL
jgi:hypothetical protein